MKKGSVTLPNQSNTTSLTVPFIKHLMIIIVEGSLMRQLDCQAGVEFTDDAQ